MKYLRNELLANLGLENEGYTDSYIGESNTDTIESINEEIEDTQSVIDDLNQTSDNLYNAEVTLESMIPVIYRQSNRGGLDRTGIALANISLESICSQLKIENNELMVSFEDEDSETATVGTIDKIKGVLNKIKNAVFGVVIKTYAAVSEMLLLFSKKADSLVQRANKLKAGVNDNEGSIKVPKRAVSTDGSTILSPPDVVKELHRLVNDTARICNVYTTSEYLAFSSELMELAKGGNANSRTKVDKFMKSLSFNMKHDLPDEYKLVVSPYIKYKASDFYLGGIMCSMESPSDLLYNEIKADNDTIARKVERHSDTGAIKKYFKYVAGGYLFLWKTAFFTKWVPGFITRNVHVPVGEYGDKLLTEAKNSTSVRKVFLDKDTFQWGTTRYTVMRENVEKFKGKVEVEKLDSNHASGICDIVATVNSIKPSIDKSNKNTKMVTKTLLDISKSMGGDEKTTLMLGAISTHMREYLTDVAQYQSQMLKNMLIVAGNTLDYVEKSNKG